MPEDTDSPVVTLSHRQHTHHLHSPTKAIQQDFLAQAGANVVKDTEDEASSASSSVSTTSLSTVSTGQATPPPQHSATTNDKQSACVVQDSPLLAERGSQRNTKKRKRSDWRAEATSGKLTDLDLSDISTLNPALASSMDSKVPDLPIVDNAGVSSRTRSHCLKLEQLRPNVYNDYFIPNVFRYVAGSTSQFNRTQSSDLPPLSTDCCQSFASIVGVLWATLGTVSGIKQLWCKSGINYLLYLSSWLHQYSSAVWSQSGKPRPYISDINNTLHLAEYFAARLCPNEFEVVCYHQRERALNLLREICVSQAPDRDGCVRCGYVIVSGDYTFGVVSLRHDKTPFPAWKLCLLDSHGSLPWSHECASITSMSVGVQGGSAKDTPTKPAMGRQADHATACQIFDAQEGIQHFSNVLFALLEHTRNHHPATAAPSCARRKASSSEAVKAFVVEEGSEEDASCIAATCRSAAPTHTRIPYTTWTPLRVREGHACTMEELITTIDERFLPMLRTIPEISREMRLHGPLRPTREFGFAAQVKQQHEEVQSIQDEDAAIIVHPSDVPLPEDPSTPTGVIEVVAPAKQAVPPKKGAAKHVVEPLFLEDSAAGSRVCPNKRPDSRLPVFPSAPQPASLRQATLDAGSNSPPPVASSKRGAKLGNDSTKSTRARKSARTKSNSNPASPKLVLTSSAANRGRGSGSADDGGGATPTPVAVPERKRPGNGLTTKAPTKEALESDECVVVQPPKRTVAGSRKPAECASLVARVQEQSEAVYDYKT